MTGVVAVSQRRRKKPSDRVWVWGGEARYDVVLDKFEKLGWRVVEDERKEGRCNLFWVDSATIHERFRNLQPWQMINHFPGMPNIARKNRMGQNLNRIAKSFPKEYNFYPRTWSLPSELADFKSQFDPSTGIALNNRIFIIKPDAGCQGKGIFLVRSWDQVPQQEGVVAQHYIKKPLLIDGYKFDLRLYVLITSVKPLRMYLFQDGLVRLCTEPYVKPTKQNLAQSCMHFSNYAINKNNSNFQAASTEDDDASSKRTLKWFMQTIVDDAGEKKAKYLWKRFGTLAVRTVLSILPTLSREYDLHFKSFSNVPIIPPEKKGSSSLTDEKCKTSYVRRISKPLSTDVGDDYDEGIDIQSAREKISHCEDEEEDDEDDEDDEDEEDADCERKDTASDTGVTTASSDTEDKSNSDGIGSRHSRCFEILGIDVMIDSNLKPWLIEVNHLPSFGTDSPLDLSVKGRLVDEILNIVPVLPDDEDTYSLYHKREAERRLTAERTASSNGKLREKAMTEKEKKEEADRIERERYTKKRAEFLRERERMAERQKAAAAAAVALAEQEERRRLEIIRINQSNAEKQSRWLQGVYALLVKIYNEYCPSKVGKIERLLEKYQGREEEFVNFVYEKYGVPFPVELSPREELEELPPEITSDSDAIKEDDPVRSQTHSGSEALSRPSKPPAAKSQSAGSSKDGRRNRYGELIRTPSPPHRRAPAAWRGDPDEEEAYRKEVLSTHQPKEDDQRLLFECDRLRSFNRIFPVFESDDAREKEEDDDNDDNENEEVEDKDAENEDTCAAAEGVEMKSKEQEALEREKEARDRDKEKDKKKKKTPLWKSHEDILCAVFLSDRRQTLRMKQPLGGQAKSNTDSKEHLPALGEPSKTVASSSVKPQGGRSLPGWKPPPHRKEPKQEPKVPGQYQIDIASRLSKGLSSSKQNNDDEKLASSRHSNKMIVSAKHRIYSNTCTSSGSAAGNIYASASIASQGSSHSYNYQSDNASTGGNIGSGYSYGPSSSTNILDTYAAFEQNSLHQMGCAEYSQNNRSGSGSAR